MTNDTRPRRFFGLLCAHHWEHWGKLHQKFVGGRIADRIILQCKHCGDIKYPKTPK